MKEASFNPLFLTVYAFSADKFLPFVATEVIPQSLRDFINVNHDESDRVQIIGRLLKEGSAALIYLNEMGIVHRDIKPDK